MPHMRTLLFLIIAGLCLSSFAGEPAARSDDFSFVKNYRIQYYLDAAIEIQKLQSDDRAARLKELAIDVKRASHVFPLCRMLFEAKPKGEFRRPMIGGASFVGGGDYADWPLEPITLYENVPVLVVRGYRLAGEGEPPASYVEYCLKECAWRETKYEPIPMEKRKQVLEKFVAANPKLKDDADWLLRQAD